MISGTFRGITEEELKHCGNINERYFKTIDKIYTENKKTFPKDIIAYFTDLIPYNVFIRKYKELYPDLIIDEFNRFMHTDKIKPEMFSVNQKESFKKFNVIPVQIYEDRIIYATTNNEGLDREIASPVNGQKQKLKDSQAFQSFLATTNTTLRANSKQPKLVRLSNKLFSDCLNYCLGEPLITIDDMIFTDEQQLDIIFITAIIKKASDIYINPLPTNDGFAVSFSIFGDTVPHRTYKKTKEQMQSILQTVIKLAKSNFDNMTFNANPVVDLRIPDLGKQNDTYYGRLNGIAQKDSMSTYNLSYVIRVCKVESAAIRYEDLRLTQSVKDELRTASQYVSGIVLISGATGSGKSTTTYSLLDDMNTTRATDRREEISAPVEAQIPGMSQLSIEALPGSESAFQLMVQAETRRNAQVIFVGETNNRDVIRSVVDMALQGKFLLSTIHIDGIPAIFDRVLGMVNGDQDTYRQFIEQIRTVMHQTMVKKVCKHCCKEVPFNELPELQRKVLSAFDYTEDTVTMLGHDPYCEHCEGRGFLLDEFVIVSSILTISEEMKDKLRDMNTGMRIVVENELFSTGKHEIFDGLKYLRQKDICLEHLWTKLNLGLLRKELVIMNSKEKKESI